MTTLILPRELMNRGLALLHQQCWLWGQDIRRAEGNLLLEYGFERKRPPEGANACSQYSLQLDAKLMVTLWGFGFAYGTRDEQMFVNRYDFRPRILRQDLDRWEPPVALPLAADSILLEAAARWVAWYERSVAKKMGENYRNRLLSQWKEHRKYRMLPAEDWLQLADDLTTARQICVHFSIGHQWAWRAR